MFSKIKTYFLLFSILFVFLSLLLFTFCNSQIALAQLWGLTNPWAQTSLWSPYQNLTQTAWQNPWQSQWISPFQSQWQSPWQSPWQSSWQSPFQTSWQNPWQNSWQNPFQTSWQNPWQQPFQNPWQTSWQNPFQNPWQQPWQNQWQQPQYQDADIDLDSGDNGDLINVAVGETISIILESNSTTGYKWVLDTTELDSAIVSNTSSKYFSGTTSLVGSGGTEQWIFEAESIGTTVIKLNYKRVWETSIEDTFEVEVTVE